MMRWTSDADAMIREYAAAGKSYSLVARKLGVSRNAVIGRAHRLGIVRRQKGKPIDVAAAIALRDEGLTFHEIAKRLDRSTMGVWCAVQRGAA